MLHTFGSQLNFNCHIHTLYTLGGISNNSEWRPNEFIPVTMLKARFKARLLHYLRDEFKHNNVIVPKYVKNEWLNKFGSSQFYNIQNILFKNNWYLYVGEKLDNVVLTVGYIGRYAKRPAISETRISYYSKLENIVKFEYHDKTTNEDKIVTMSVNNFIGLLIRHIPEKHFHMIRYYGMYANARKNKIFQIISRQIISLFGIANLLFEFAFNRAKTWRQRVLEQTGVDPLKCKDCGITMSLTQITYRIRDGTQKTIHFF
ncbi:MAG: transposase [Vicingaceae bacterium]|nr:transposase [Vicingaceae bacterium]